MVYDLPREVITLCVSTKNLYIKWSILTKVLTNDAFFETRCLLEEDIHDLQLGLGLGLGLGLARSLVQDYMYIDYMYIDYMYIDYLRRKSLS